MRELFTRKFWLDATERAIKTAAQVFIVGSGLSESATGLLNINWIGALSLAGGGALLSYLTSVISARVTLNDSASLVES